MASPALILRFLVFHCQSAAAVCVEMFIYCSLDSISTSVPIGTIVRCHIVAVLNSLSHTPMQCLPLSVPCSAFNMDAILCHLPSFLPRMLVAWTSALHCTAHLHLVFFLARMVMKCRNWWNCRRLHVRECNGGVCPMCVRLWWFFGVQKQPSTLPDQIFFFDVPSVGIFLFCALLGTFQFHAAPQLHFK